MMGHGLRLRGRSVRAAILHGLMVTCTFLWYACFFRRAMIFFILYGTLESVVTSEACVY